MRLLKADVLKKTFNDDLKVWENTFICIYGEKNFKSEGIGKHNSEVKTSSYSLSCSYCTLINVCS